MNDGSDPARTLSTNSRPQPGSRLQRGPAAGQVPTTERRATGTTTGVTAVIVFVFACALVADRAVLAIATGGRGALPLMTFMAPTAALWAVARHGTGQTLAFARSPVFLIGVLPYLGLAFVLPFLGVMFNRYPERTLISITEATTAFSFLVLGAAASTAPLRHWRPWITIAIVLQLTYAAGQTAYLGRWPGWELFSPLHAWDLSYQGLYGDFVQARASGLYFNPNELGLWAGVAAVLAWAVMTPRWRLAGVVLAVMTLLLSQSRGATVALVAALAAGITMAFVHRRVRAPHAARTAISVGLAVAVAIVVVVVVQPSHDLVDRFSALATVWAQGPRADLNLAGRLDYWASVIDLNAVYPLGTWGPPESLLGSAVDSTWFRVFAQGSVLYVGALVLLLVSPFAVRDSWFKDTLIVITVLLAVAGLTQTPLNYPIAFLFWALLGAALQASVSEKSTDKVTVSHGAPRRRPGSAGTPPDHRSRRRGREPAAGPSLTGAHPTDAQDP